MNSMELLVEVLPAVAVGVTVWGLLTYLNIQSRKYATVNPDGTYELRHGSYMIFIGWLGLLIAFVSLLAAIWISVKEPDSEVWTWYALSGMFTSLGLPTLLMGKYIKVKVDEKTITQFGITKKVKKIYWNSVSRVSFNRYTQTLSLSDGTTTVNIPYYFKGFRSLMVQIQEKIDPGVAKAAIAEVSKFRGTSNGGWG